MQTKAAAVHGFMSRFGMTAYASGAVPDSASYPYIEYDVAEGSFGEKCSASMRIWFKTRSEKIPNAKVDEIAKTVTRGGVVLPCDGGAIWIKRGSPFAQAAAGDEPLVKMHLVNLEVEYITDI